MGGRFFFFLIVIKCYCRDEIKNCSSIPNTKRMLVGDVPPYQEGAGEPWERGRPVDTQRERHSLTDSPVSVISVPTADGASGC